jgi:peptide/nickel transport system substrate-binding protein
MQHKGASSNTKKNKEGIVDQRISPKKRIPLGLTICAIFLFAVLHGGIIPKATGAESEKPRYGGILKVITSLGSVNLGYPAAGYLPSDYMMADPAVETLFRLDNQARPTPWLATGYKISKDLKTLTLTLRKGVKFHDNTDFNAEAVKYLLDIYRSSAMSELKSVTSIDVVDSHTVRLNLSEFQIQLVPNLAFRPGQMISPTAIKTQGKDWCMTHPVGTGPFKFVSYQRDSSLKYEKFPGYWQKGKPYLDGVEVEFIADKTSAIMAFKSGRAHVRSSLTPQHLSELKESGKYLTTTIPIAVYALAGDSGHPNSPFADVRVRRAIEYAVDKATIAKTIGYNIYKPASQLSAIETWYYNPSVKGYEYNPQKAKELLAQAGYPNGFKTRIMYPTADPQDVFTAIQGYLAQVGIDAKLEPVAPPLFVQNQTGGWENSMMWFNCSTGTHIDPGYILENRLSSKGSQFVSITHPADYEKILFSAATELDVKKRKAFYQSVMKSISDNVLVTPIYVAYSGMAAYPEVRKLGMNEIAMHLWTPEDAWLAK